MSYTDGMSTKFNNIECALEIENIPMAIHNIIVSSVFIEFHDWISNYL